MIVAASPELYRLGERDLNTLLVEPFFGRRQVDLAAAAAGGNAVVDIPPDRICIMETCSCLLVEETATNWQGASVQWKASTAGNADYLNVAQKRVTGAGASIVGGAGKGGSVELLDRHLTMPPGGNLRFSIYRESGAPAANAAFGVFWFSCFLIPAGNVGRVS